MAKNISQRAKKVIKYVCLDFFANLLVCTQTTIVFPIKAKMAIIVMINGNTNNPLRLSFDDSLMRLQKSGVSSDAIIPIASHVQLLGGRCIALQNSSTLEKPNILYGNDAVILVHSVRFN